jgi:hypothetical protein
MIPDRHKTPLLIPYHGYTMMILISYQLQYSRYCQYPIVPDDIKVVCNLHLIKLALKYHFVSVVSSFTDTEWDNNLQSHTVPVKSSFGSMLFGGM